MNKKIHYIIGLLVLIFSTMPKQISAQEWRTELGVKYDINNKLEAKLKFEQRFLVLESLHGHKTLSEISLDYKLNSFFELGGGYRYGLERDVNPGSSDFDIDDRERYTVDLKIKLPLNKDLELENRSRYQIKLKEAWNPDRAYRNRTTLEFDIDGRTKFCVGDEVYYNITKGRITANRVLMGIEYELLKNVEFSAGFYVDMIKRPYALKSNYVLNTGITINL